jgi:hypothetical protein
MFTGLWFAATLPADLFGDFLGGFWSAMAKPQFFIMIAAIAEIAAARSCAARPHAAGLTPSVNESKDQCA